MPSTTRAGTTGDSTTARNVRATAGTTIPRIVHQTSKSRCLTDKLALPVRQWQLFVEKQRQRQQRHNGGGGGGGEDNEDHDDDGWSYYFHSDDSVNELFREFSGEFPLLNPLLEGSDCMPRGTLRADVWRYLVLYAHGGIYADLDTVPNAPLYEWFDKRQRQHGAEKGNNSTGGAVVDDALFVVEQFHMLSQYFMAVSPRHPLMWYAIQISLRNLLSAPDAGRISAPVVTGPHALHAALQQFVRDSHSLVQVGPAGIGHKPVRAGTYVGTKNRTITVVGVGENENEYVQRDVIGLKDKREEYRKLNMTHFSDDKLGTRTGRSCLSSMLHHQLPS